MSSSFTRLLVVTAALVIIAFGLRAAADFLAPLILGGFVVVLCIPIVEAFGRRGWPHWAAVLASTIAYVAAVAVLAVIALVSLRELVELVPELTSGAADAESEIGGFLEPIIGAEAAAAVATAMRLAQVLPSSRTWRWASSRRRSCSAWRA
jgi:predicted PurR-regulated permease PerM